MASLTLEETMERLLLNIQAGHPVIYVVTHEEERVLDYLARLMRVIVASDPRKSFLCWYEGEGLRMLRQEGSGGAPGNLRPEPPPKEIGDWLKIPGIEPGMRWHPVSHEGPAETLRSIKVADMNSFPILGDSLSVFFDVHPFVRNDSHTRSPYGSLVRPVRNVAAELREYYDQSRNDAGGGEGFPFKTVVIVSPTADEFSLELERDVIMVDFPLPEENELIGTLENMVSRGVLAFSSEVAEDERREVLRTEGGHGEAPAGEPEAQNDQEAYQTRLRDMVAGAGRGLTLEAYKLGLNGFAVRDRQLRHRHVKNMLDLKANAINNRALEYTPHVDVQLGGLTAIKDWIAKRRDVVRYGSIREKYHLPPLSGVMLCGVSGGGKSMLAKLMAKEFSLALLRLDVGALFGSYIGESEQRTRDALRLAEVLAPVVLWLDEIDKAFSGIQGGGDNGVSARVFGSFLTWLAEKTESVFVVTTANDFKRLLKDFPEFGRKGRFDEIFWVDLPDQAARRRIFQIYLEPFFKRDYITMSDADVDRLATDNLCQIPNGNSVAERLSGLLSETLLSVAMTGAEIEHATKECVYEIYNLPDNARNGLGMGQKIVETVQAAKDRAMYRPGTPTHARLVELRADAALNGWPSVGDTNI